MPAKPEHHVNRATAVQMATYRTATTQAPEPAPEPKRPEPLAGNPSRALL